MFQHENLFSIKLIRANNYHTLQMRVLVSVFHLIQLLQHFALVLVSLRSDHSLKFELKIICYRADENHTSISALWLLLSGGYIRRFCSVT